MQSCAYRFSFSEITESTAHATRVLQLVFFKSGQVLVFKNFLSLFYLPFNENAIFEGAESR